MAKVAFFYCIGTQGIGDWSVNPAMDTIAGFITNIGKVFKKKDGGSTETKDKIAPAILGWSEDGNHSSMLFDFEGGNDPFPRMLNPDKFDAKTIPYPAGAIAMGLSIDTGAASVIEEIKKLPVGQPFCLGGYSQGAAVMSKVYNEIRTGSLTSRAPYFLGAITFGNPMRQLNHRGAVGGTWSGSLGQPGSTTGSHGCFPASGPFARLTGTEDKWVDFVNTAEVITGLGDTTADEVNFVNAADCLLSYSPLELLTVWPLQGAANIISAAHIMAFAGSKYEGLDALGREVSIPGGGHTLYPALPPPGDPDNGLTSYQIALKYLDGLADQWATAPISLPSTSAGWSTVLRPPAV